MITTVFFDLDETLLDFHSAETSAIRRTLIRLNIPPAEETIARYSAINKSQWELLERGELTRPQVLCRRFELLFQELGVERSGQEAHEIYRDLLREGHDFIPGAREMLDTLQGHYAMYLVSNGNAYTQDQRLKDADLNRYFEKVFISERVGYDKPDRRFFERCFAEIPGFSKEEAIMVGDSLTSDIQGGRNAGIRTCWFNPAGKPADPAIPADYEISELAQLPPLLGRIGAADS